METWNYDQVTENAVARITSLIVAQNDTGDSVRKQWAYGVYLGWSSLTTGWQRRGVETEAVN